MVEIWKDIPGYEGIYQASSHGRIKRVAGSAWNGIKWHHKKEKILTPSPAGSMGHIGVALSKNGKPKTFRVHVLICLAFYGERPQGYHVLHINGDPQDNRVENLKYGTAKENIHQSYIDSGKSAARNQRLITFNGVTKDCTEWSLSLGGNYHLVQDRLNQGWSLDDALSTPAKLPELIDFNGNSMTVGEWGELTGIPPRTIRNRLKNGWTVEKALFTPVAKIYEFNGQSMTIAEWAKETGIPIGTIKDRLRKGWDLHKVFS